MIVSTFTNPGYDGGQEKAIIRQLYFLHKNQEKVKSTSIYNFAVSITICQLNL